MFANDWSIRIIDNYVIYVYIAPKRYLVSHFFGIALLGIDFLRDAQIKSEPARTVLDRSEIGPSPSAGCEFHCRKKKRISTTSVSFIVIKKKN